MRRTFGGGVQFENTGTLPRDISLTFRALNPFPTLFNSQQPMAFAAGRNPCKLMVDAPQNLAGFCRFPPSMKTSGFFRGLSLPLVPARGWCSPWAGIHPIPSFFQIPSFCHGIVPSFSAGMAIPVFLNVKTLIPNSCSPIRAAVMNILYLLFNLILY